MPAYFDCLNFEAPVITSRNTCQLVEQTTLSISIISDSHDFLFHSCLGRFLSMVPACPKNRRPSTDGVRWSALNKARPRRQRKEGIWRRPRLRNFHFPIGTASFSNLKAKQNTEPPAPVHGYNCKSHGQPGFITISVAPGSSR